MSEHLVSAVDFVCNPRCQRIEIPVPGGYLRADALGGGAYPSISLYFVRSGSESEIPLAFAEARAEEDPDHVYVGVFFEDCDDVHDIYSFSTKGGEV